MVRKSHAGPPKVPDLLQEIRRLLDRGRYLETSHAQEMMAERAITRMEVHHVLRHGRHEAKKDRRSDDGAAWKYAIRGRTFDADRELRVVALLNELGVLVITAIDLAQ